MLELLFILATVIFSPNSDKGAWMSIGIFFLGIFMPIFLAERVRRKTIQRFALEHTCTFYRNLVYPTFPTDIFPIISGTTGSIIQESVQNIVIGELNGKPLVMFDKYEHHGGHSRRRLLMFVTLTIINGISYKKKRKLLGSLILSSLRGAYYINPQEVEDIIQGRVPQSVIMLGPFTDVRYSHKSLQSAEDTKEYLDTLLAHGGVWIQNRTELAKAYGITPGSMMRNVIIAVIAFSVITALILMNI